MQKSSVLWIAAIVVLAVMPTTAVAAEPPKNEENMSQKEPVPLKQKIAEPTGAPKKPAKLGAVGSPVTAKPASGGTVSATKTALNEAKTESKKETANGSYKYKRYYGAGLEFGYWFNYLDRLGMYVYENNGGKPFDIIGQWNLDISVESSFLEYTRLSIFGGIQSPIVSNPKILAAYGGIEPAFSFRRGNWEAAIGIGIGFGGILSKGEVANGSNAKSEESFDATLFLLRPFFELRYYLKTYLGVYGRVGFNQWLIRDSNGITPRDNHYKKSVDVTNLDNLNEGGAYVSIGVRFGSYEKPVLIINDRDGDGLNDDVDECPDDPEDFDKFEDEDGCPDLDNDKDGILDVDDKCPNVPGKAFSGKFEELNGCPDADGDNIPDKVDKCPNEPEDFDGFEDEDGCPEPDNDKDGILDKVDKCPNNPEDKDGIQDEDGCPETDADFDAILDPDDKCPLVAGVPQKQGCPFDKVRITIDKIIIKEKIFFIFDKWVINKTSYPLLNDVASFILAYPRIKKIEVAGHTDYHGTDNYNLVLSQKRADSVRNYLIKRGVSKDILIAKGYGKSKPIVPIPTDGKETKAGAQKNRRVEFNILEQDTITKIVSEEQIEEIKKEEPGKIEVEKIE